ncbi:MAG: calcium/sodium antiporter [Bacteroidales bacterium]|nr:calcium/sodium antiporter [Bacteroidales bacterium]
MALQIFLFLLGLGLIVYGADWLVDGASSVARKFGISEFVIGLTIVGMGTSAPEMVVSFIGAIHGNADIAVGNVFGSNIFNTLLILGITAVIMPMPITRANLRRDIPLNLAVTLLILLLGPTALLLGVGNNTLTRLDGAILLTVFALYMFFSFKYGEKDNGTSEEKIIKPWLATLMIIGGLGCLIGGGQLFVNSATAIAKALGISDKFIAITILAGGTSMPELATCIVAAIKKKGQLALGNILGSNIFNILLILGGSALISPLSFGSMNLVDTGVLLLSALLLLASAFMGKKDQLDRFDGAIFLLCEAAYFTWLCINL